MRSHPIHELIVQESVIDGLRYLGEDFKQKISKENMTDEDKQDIAESIYPFIWDTCECFEIIDPENFKIEETALDLAIESTLEINLESNLQLVVELGLVGKARMFGKKRLKYNVAPKRKVMAKNLNIAANKGIERSDSHFKTVGNKLQSAGAHLKQGNVFRAGGKAIGAGVSAIRGVARRGLSYGKKLASAYASNSAKRFEAAPAKYQRRLDNRAKIKAQEASREKDIWGGAT